jgi:hypothetical protein
MPEKCQKRPFTRANQHPSFSQKMGWRPMSFKITLACEGIDASVKRQQHKTSKLNFANIADGIER